MLAEGQSCIYEDGRVERKRREAIAVVPVWGSEGLASRVSQRWSGQVQERVMIRLGNVMRLQWT